MPDRIDDTVRRRIAWSYYLGKTEQNIAQEEKVSVGTVRNVIKELKAGRFPEYRDNLSYLDELRRLSQQLKKTGQTLQGAIAGTLLLTLLAKLGVEPSELEDLLKLLQEISPPGFPVQAFVRAALRVTKLEQETGLSFQELESRAVQLPSEIATMEITMTALVKKVDSLRVDERQATESRDRAIKEGNAELERLRKAIAVELENNKLTKEQLANYLDTQRKLNAYGIDFNKLENLEKVLAEVQRHSWQATVIVEYISRIDTLTGQVQAWTKEVEKVQADLAERKKDLETLITTITDAKKELGALQAFKIKMLDELSVLKREADAVYLRNEFGSTWELLLNDTAKVPSFHITRVIEKLRLILQARETTKGLPIDYDSARPEFIFLLEAVSGKKLKPRDWMEQQMKALTDMNNDLMFNRVGKIEEKLNKAKSAEAALESREKALDIDESAFHNFSEKSLLKLMLERVRTGTVHVNACGHCESVFAFELGSRRGCSEPLKCPFCHSPLNQGILAQTSNGQSQVIRSGAQ